MHPFGKDARTITARLRERGLGAPSAVAVRILADVLSALGPPSPGKRSAQRAERAEGPAGGFTPPLTGQGSVILTYDGFAKVTGGISAAAAGALAHELLTGSAP